MTTRTGRRPRRPGSGRRAATSAARRVTTGVATGIVTGIALLAVIAAGPLEAGAQAGGHAGVPIARGWPLDRDAMVKVFSPAGRIRVIGWDRDSVDVRGSVSAAGTFYGGGSRRGVKFGLEGNAPGIQGDLVVRVPAGAVVWVRGAATDIEVEGLTGGVDVGCVSGTVRVSGDPRELVAEAMEGTVEIIGSPDYLRARTASGALRWRGQAMDALLGSVTGPIEALGGPFARVRIETISGDVTLDGALQPGADVTIESHSGVVALRLPARLPARLSVDAPRVVGEPGAAAAPPGAGKRPAPRTIAINGATAGDASAAMVTVRSFKGELRLLPSRTR